MGTPAEDAAVYAFVAGCRDVERLTIAVAIAGGESGWNPQAVGDTGITDDTWGPSIGIWQIRSIRSQQGTGQPRDSDRLADPQFNANSMWAISSQGSNWGPWTIYKTGAYRSFLPEAAAAASVAVAAGPSAGPGGYVLDLTGRSILGKKGVSDVTGGAPIGGAISSALDVGKKAVELLGKLGDVGIWKRIGLGAVGVLVVLAGAGMVTGGLAGGVLDPAQGSPPAKPPAKPAAKAGTEAVSNAIPPGEVVP